MKNQVLSNQSERESYNSSEMIGLKNYYGASWKKFLTDDKVYDLLEDIGLKQFAILEVKSNRSRSKDRFSKTVTIQMHDGRKHVVFIDVKSGVPAWQQFIDVTYDSGVNSDLKIIVFDQEYDCENYDSPMDNAAMVGNLVSRNNRCGVLTRLMQFEGYIESGNRNCVCFIVKGYSKDEHVGINKLLSGDMKSSENLPTKRQIQEAEFWVGHYLPRMNWDGAASAIMDDDIIYDWTPSYSLSGNLHTEASWNEDGLHCAITLDNGTEVSDVLTWIWTNKKDKLQKNYPDKLIELKYEMEKPVAISVRIYHIPMSELIEMSSADRDRYGDDVNEEERKFAYLAMELISDYKEANNVVHASDILRNS